MTTEDTNPAEGAGKSTSGQVGSARPLHPNCLNCGAPLHGEWCHVCGQRDVDPRASLWTVLAEFFGEVFEIDGRLARTIPAFLFRPGALTVAFAEGRRASYTSPVRLYVFAALVSFFVFAKVAERGLEHIDANDAIVLEERPAEGATTSTGIPAPPGALVFDASGRRGSSQEKPGPSRLEFDEGAPRKLRELAALPPEQMLKLLLRDFFEWVPFAMIVLLFAFASALQVLHWRAPFQVHVVHSLVLHALALVLSSIAALVQQPWLVAVAFIAMEIHLLVGLRRIHARSWIVTTMVVLALTMFYALALALTFGAAVAIAILV